MIGDLANNCLYFVAAINASTGISIAFSLRCHDYESYFKTIMRSTSLSMPIVILEQ